MNMTTRTKKVAILPPQNLSQAEKVLATYAEADARIQQINSTMDEAFTKIRDKFAVELQELNEKRTVAFEKVQMFAEMNPDLFPKKKSFDMAQGTIGFRTGTPKLKTLKGFTWASVTNMLKEFLPDYVRTVEEPAKDKLLADREVEEVASSFKKVGIEVVQDETFYIDLKKEEIS